jgi:MFS family permease
MKNQEKTVEFPPIPKAIWVIGWATFLLNTSSVMVFSLCAVYLKSILGISTGWIGLLEGVVEGSAYATRIFSGVLSDYLRRRKVIVCLGYFIVTVTRPILAISSSFTGVFTARMLDRLGNGIQATPRDALISDIAPQTIKGECFGLRISLGTAGSLFGGIAGIAVMLWTANNYHIVFWMATIPAFFAFVILVFAVSEPEQNLHPADHKKRHPIRWSDIPRLGKSYWMIMIVVSCFMLARVGEVFLVIHVHKNFGLSAGYAPLVHILYNATYALSSYPVGWLSDRYSRYTLLGIGMVVLIITDIVLGFAQSLTMAFFGIVLWGIQMGISQSMFLALVADHVPEDLRGTGFGFFYLISSVSIIVASIIAGVIADHYGEGASFQYSSIIAFVSLLLLIGVRLSNKKRKRLAERG